MAANKTIDEKMVSNIVSQVLSQLGTPAVTSSKSKDCGCDGPCCHGVYEDTDKAIVAARDAFEQLQEAGVAARRKVVDIIRATCLEKADEWGQLELNETRIGRLEHKVAKLVGIPNIPGVEWLQPLGMSGDHGIAMEENTPFGVVGAITPVTHSIPTIACNAINMIAAGNTVVFNAHPGGAKCAAVAVEEFNRRIKSAIGISNLLTMVKEPTLDSFNAICSHELINLLCITGGPAVVEAAMQSGKRAICAGPGNPPVLVDDTAHMDKAAQHIIDGAAFDNNLLCIGEKQVFVTDAAYSKFIASFEKAGAVKLTAGELAKLTAEAFTTRTDAGGCSHPVLNRDLVGADASVLAQVAGRRVDPAVRLLYAETDLSHPFVMEEQMMPMIPVVKVPSVEEGIRQALVSEHGYKHSSMIHSLNVEHMTMMARALDSTIFVKNGSCLAGLGAGGEGYPSFSIATTTGEGITTPMTFTRKRRCVLVDQLKIY
jgi:aldehyde dehydrogenase